MFGLTVFLLAAVQAGAGDAGAPQEAARALARRVEERQRSVVDLRGHFVQSYRSGILGREVVERGTVQLKRPGLMRWDYTDPESKTFVFDGKTFFFYVPQDKQVVVRDEKGSHALTADLLSGRLDILDKFDVALEAPVKGHSRLRLVPMKPDPEVQEVLVETDPSAEILSIEILDSQGNRSRFDFHDVRENQGIPDKVFRFEVPKGVEVVSG